MSELKRIDEMTDDELYSAAVEAFNKVKYPSNGLKFLYDVWLGKDRLKSMKVRRVYTETIYKLSLFEKDALGEEAW